MSIIKTTLSGLRLGAEQRHADLVMIPLLGEGLTTPDYLLLDAALETKRARVTEISEGGSVPTLRFENNGERPVLLLDGEELIGAKQNRILNLSVLAPANEHIEIPVSCVEAGRWRHVSAEFRSAKRAHYATGRSHKAAKVSQSLIGAELRHADQGAIWRDIHAKSARMRVQSDTAAAAALYDSRRRQLDDYDRAFHTVSQQLGAVFVLAGKVISLDLFDCAQTCTETLPKLVQSCALDALDAQFADAIASAGLDGLPPFDPARQPRPTAAADAKITPLDAAGTFLQALTEASTQAFDAIGEGQDLRFTGQVVAGGALVARDRLIHLCAFPVAADAADRRRRQRARRSHIARPSRRDSDIS